MPNLSAPLDRVFHALADPTRLAVIDALCRGPRPVADLARAFPMTLPSFMLHLRVLESTGLIASEKAGRVRTCRLEPSSLAPIERWVRDRRALWSARLDRLGAYLEEKPKRRKRK